MHDCYAVICHGTTDRAPGTSVDIPSCCAQTWGVFASGRELLLVENSPLESGGISCRSIFKWVPPPLADRCREESFFRDFPRQASKQGGRNSGPLLPYLQGCVGKYLFNEVPCEVLKVQSGEITQRSLHCICRCLQARSQGNLHGGGPPSMTVEAHGPCSTLLPGMHADSAPQAHGAPAQGRLESLEGWRAQEYYLSNSTISKQTWATIKWPNVILPSVLATNLSICCVTGDMHACLLSLCAAIIFFLPIVICNALRHILVGQKHSCFIKKCILLEVAKKAQRKALNTKLLSFSVMEGSGF